MKKLLTAVLLAATFMANACWFTELNYNKHYIARINTTVVFPENAVWTGNPIIALPAGKQNVPAQIWIKLQPRGEAGAPQIEEALLQYKKLPDGQWITFKALNKNQLNWNIDFNKEVELFGPNVFDPPGATENDEYLIRLWFYDGLYENADTGLDAPAEGNTQWISQWINKIIIGKRRSL